MQSSSSDEDGRASSNRLAESSRKHATVAKSARAQRQMIWSKTAWSLVTFTFAFAYIVLTSFTRRDPADASQCEMAWMHPSYIRMTGLDGNHSRLANKYSLYLYRELGLDTSNQPSGIPVLFVPGNAGSYQQVRSLAAQAAASYYASPGVPNQHLYDAGARQMDVFAADFNEDFSAFHSTTLREQAEYLAACVRYILSLYDGTHGLIPTAVIMIAHSMGGISTRLMMLDPNLPKDSVKTIITLSTPHMIPPVTFDAGMDTLYREINEYWTESYKKVDLTNPLREVILISIAGGTADTMLSSDYSGVSEFTPPSNGFAVLTTTIPTLFSAVDHRAMAWCDQLRKSIIQGLLNTLDVSESSRAQPLAKRLAAMQKALLTGLENQSTTVKLLDGTESHAPHVAERENHISLDILPGQQAAGILQLPKSQDRDLHEHLTSFRIHILTDIDPSAIKLELCRVHGDTSECRQAEPVSVARLPESLPSTPEFPVKPVAQASMHYAQMNPGPFFDELRFTVDSERRGFLHASLGELNDKTDNIDLLSLAGAGRSVRIPEGVVSEAYSFPHIGSSLLAYSVKAKRQNCEQAPAPMIRVFSEGMHESKFHPNVKHATSYLHGPAPFLLPEESVNVHIWKHPQCEVELHLSIDWYASAGKLVLRYRSVGVAWPVAIVLLVLRRQLSPASAVSSRTFSHEIHAFIHKDLYKVCTAIGVLTAFQALILARAPVQAIASAILGTSQLLFALLSMVLVLVSAGTVLVLHIMLSVIVLFWAKIRSLLVGPVGRDLKVSSVEPGTSSRPLVAFGLLVLLVMVYAPHQLAFAILFLVQLDTTACSARMCKIQKRPDRDGGVGISYTVLFIMTMLLPHHGTVLLVWIRNLQAGWFKPYPSDHNILSILGALLLVCRLRQGRSLRVPRSPLAKSSLSCFLSGTAALVFVYGARHTYLVNRLVNIVFISLYALQFMS